jgi:hypothetical protein
MPKRRYTKWAGRFPPGSPAEWVAGGHVTCNIRCLNGGCKRMVDMRLDRLPLDRPWSRVGWCLVCTECGAAGSVNIVPNWHDMTGHAVPFSPSWHTRSGAAVTLAEAGASGEGT